MRALPRLPRDPTGIYNQPTGADACLPHPDLEDAPAAYRRIRSCESTGETISLPSGVLDGRSGYRFVQRLRGPDIDGTGVSPKAEPVDLHARHRSGDLQELCRLPPTG